MMDDVGQKSVFENYGLELTLESVSNATQGLLKRVFTLKRVNQAPEQPLESDEGALQSEVRQIVHLQTTRWEDDCAITEKSHYEDLDKMIKQIKKHRGEGDLVDT